MKAFPIWSEGYQATGEFGTAHFHGWSSGDNFLDACHNFADAHPEFKCYYNKEYNTYWGCGLFQEEFMARRNFG